MNASVQRLLLALALFVSLVAVGTGGYCALGGGRWSLADCAYMSVVTISTVGFSELGHMREVPGARAVTVGLIVGGVGVLAYMHRT